MSKNCACAGAWVFHYNLLFFNELVVAQFLTNDLILKVHMFLSIIVLLCRYDSPMRTTGVGAMALFAFPNFLNYLHRRVKRLPDA